MKKEYFLFDSRYRTKPFRATCFESCETLKEAKENAPEYGNDTVIVSYEINNNNEMLNPEILN